MMVTSGHSGFLIHALAIITLALIDPILVESLSISRNNGYTKSLIVISTFIELPDDKSFQHGQQYYKNNA